MLAPLALLAAAEIVLRLAGLGGYPPTIRPIGEGRFGTMVVTDNAGAASYFDLRRSRPGTLSPTVFSARKRPGTVRIVLAGESAIKGFPQPAGWSAGAFLDDELRALWPDRNVEVINLGTTAVASFAVLDMLTQVLPYEVDLVVIYAGHNEFFGACGVASTHQGGGGPRMLRVRRAAGSLAVVQALSRLGGAVSEQGPPQTLMETVVAEAMIPPDSPHRRDALENLETHVRLMISRARAAGAEVIVCIPPVNEAGLAPIGRCTLDGVKPEDRARVEQALATNPEEAKDVLAMLVEAAQLAPRHAGVQYALGRAYLAAGAIEKARAAFAAAVENDPMPWRLTPSGAEALRRAGEAEGAIVCDVAGAFRATSADGCIGWELMDDHVHPSLRGQWLIARTLIEAMRALHGPARVEPELLARRADFETSLARVLPNPYDEYTVVEQLARVGEVPFVRESNPTVYERFSRREQELLAAMSPAARAEAERWKNPNTHPGLRIPLSGMAAKVLIGQGRFAEAEPLFAAARRHVPLYNGLQFEYTFYLLACRKQVRGRISDDDRLLARATIERIEEFLQLAEQTSGQPERYLGRMLQLLEEHQAALSYLEKARGKLQGAEAVAVDMAMIEAHLALGDVAAARAIAEGGAAGGGFAEMYRKALAALPSPASE
jgi:tetratricopeptide (TPR) repeat protein